MVKIEMGVVINRPTEDVFAYVANAENLPRWRATALEVRQTSDGPHRLGTTYSGKFTFLGRPFDGSLEITGHEPSRKYAIRMMTGPFPLEAHYTFEPTERATRLTLVVEGEPGGFFKLAEPLVGSLAKRQYETDLHALKVLLEAGTL